MPSTHEQQRCCPVADADSQRSQFREVQPLLDFAGCEMPDGPVGHPQAHMRVAISAKRIRWARVSGAKERSDTAVVCDMPMILPIL